MTSSVLQRLTAGRQRAAVSFAGQGAGALGELSTLVAQHPALREPLAVAAAELAAAVATVEGQSSGQYRHGLDLVAWADDPQGAPPPAYLHGAAISYPLILTTQALLWQALWADGFAAAVEGGAIVAAAGHSQGLLSALLVSEAGTAGIDDALLARWVRIAWAVGLHAARGAEPVRDADGSPTPLASVSGPRLARLTPLLEEVNATVAPARAATIALVNSPRRHVVGGPPTTLALLRERLCAQASHEAAQRRDGRRGGAALTFAWSWLDVDVAFHTPSQQASCDALVGWLERNAALLPSPDALTLPVLSPADGSDLRAGDSLAHALADTQLVAPVRWDLVNAQLVDRGADWILDLGPGTDVAQLTAENLRGHGSRTLALASPEGRRRLTVAGAAPEGPDVRYADDAPGVVTLPDGRRHLDGRYARRTGLPPVILAGMTPTTADAPIVAAAANAGYRAELAGGGQPDRWTFERRMAELDELLEPGREVVFNTLLLDRHLWELHVGGDALVVGARRAGAPLVGLTVSAGVPEVDEALALLSELSAAGLVLNAFKPGTVEQVRQVLAIADAAPQHTIAVHLEGGRGGGHHSWEELDELLLETYHDLRQRENLLICAGGGVADPARAAELLCGTWSVVHGERPMPVDAVLVGTAAMACAEASASPAVKRALVAAGGGADWVLRGGAHGGVLSARSNLGADIHLLDNAAARVALLLEEVAGDATAVRARRDEIVAALAQTAKPYFGDLATLTYGELLQRFTAACATGRHGRYDDGAWGHPTWRRRALDLYRRCAARLHPAQAGPIDAPVARPADLDDPAEALARFRAAFPAADATLLHPADEQAFLELCDCPGKPVPFVPVLDGEVRRWFMADALWQAQDDRLGADGVLVIPGPRSVTGITRCDEPVGELLARFEAEAIDRAAAAGGPLARRDRLADPGPVPEPLAGAIAGHDGPVAALCAAPSIGAPGGHGRRRPNALWSLVALGDDIATVLDDAGALSAIEVRPAGGHTDERVRVEAEDDAVHVRLWMPALDGPPAALELGWRREGTAGDAPFVALGDDPGTGAAAFSRRMLGAGQTPPPGDVFAAVTVPWSCSHERAVAHRAATGATHDGGLDLAYALAWPALAGVLAREPLAPRLGELIHTAHAIEPGPAWPPAAGEAGSARAEIVLLDDPAGAPTRIGCRATLTGPRGALATIDAEFAVLGPEPVTDRRELRREAIDVVLDLAGDGDVDWLRDQPWLGRPAAPLRPGQRVTLQVVCVTDRHRSATPCWTATGRLTADGATLASIDWTAPAGSGDHPLMAAAALLGPAPGAPQPRPRIPVAERQDTAPATMSAFARISGDGNPLHRSVLAARLGGLRAPIVHGSWTAARASAFVVDELCDGDPRALRRWRIDFIAPIALGAALDLEAARIAVRDGCSVVEVTVLADGEIAARGEALVAPPPTLLTFCGQGVQRRGLGADGRSRSRAARAVWERADAHCRARLGFSLTTIVDDDPTELRLADGRVRRHPDGVLQRTEFTQPALIALAAAQLAELEEARLLDGAPLAAGHSVGEFAALVALGVLELETALDLVHRRGELMQQQVPRTPDGTSAYRMAVVDPSAAGIGLDRLEAAVAAAAIAGGEPLEVVNHNALQRQYGVAGGARAVAALAAALPERRAVRVLAGVDVPFHSSVLAPAVAPFRATLETALGAVDHRRLVGRWIPNLVGRPFSLQPDFVAAVLGEPAVAAPAEDADALARRLVVELLARQLAAPVRWVDTQRAAIAPVSAGGLGVRRLVEVGPDHAPVLTGLARMTLDELSLDGRTPALLHVELDREALSGAAAPPAAAPASGVEAVPDRPAPGPPPAPAATAMPAGGAVADRAIDAGTALRLVLAVQARVRPEQIDDEEPLDELFQGASSRRNQVLLDLGREFGLSGAEGVATRPIGELAQRLRDEGGHYRFPGGYLRDTMSSGLTRALGRAAMTQADALAHLTTAWGLGPGLAEHALAVLALETRSGPSARGGALGRLSEVAATDPAAGRALVDEAAQLVGGALGVPLVRAAPAVAAAPATTVEAAAAGGVATALAAGAHALLNGLGRPADPPPQPPRADPAADRLAILDAELGAERAALIAPRFDARRHVRFAAAWASTRWDLVGAYHDARARRRPGDELAAEFDRLAAHAGDPLLAGTARYLAGRADDHGIPDLAATLRGVADGRGAPPIPAGQRPVSALDADGGIVAAVQPDPRRPHDLIDALTAPDGSGALSLRDPHAAAELAAGLREALGARRDLRGETALVTGASPGSIGAALVRWLLRGGATVVVATSTDTPARRRWYRELYRTTAGPGAVLHVLPANLASFADVDALAAWPARPATARRGRPDLRIDPLAVTLLAPFAALPTAGDLDAAGPAGEVALRLQLLGVERLIGAVAAQADGAAAPTVLLPLSPNVGTFGGDGAYAESKAGLEVVLERWHSEHAAWGRNVRLIAPRLGWVRGTGLMAANDAVAGLLEERHGVRTFDADEVGWLLGVLGGPGPLRERAAAGPIELDATGGLSAIGGLRAAVAPLADELRRRSAAARRRAQLDAAGRPRDREPAIAALPGVDTHVRAGASAAALPPVPDGLAPEDLVVIVGGGELGPLGTAAVRFDVEVDGAPSEASIAEVAWLCGLVEYQREGYRGRWIDAATRREVAESELGARYAAAVAERIGVRALEADGAIAADGLPVLTPVALPAGLTFPVDDEAHARSFAAAAPEHVDVLHDDASGTWSVRLAAGAQIRVPRTVEHRRRIAGQFPTGLQLGRFGIPDDLLATADRMALVNLACSVEAFAQAGLTPEELLGEVHPALVANTQGAGMGGMGSMRRLLLDHLLDQERLPDRLQESLGNVVAAHTVQSFVGSYGAMVHPVAACATAAISLEEAVDKIRGGRALAVLAGGFDDLTPEGLIGFGDMGATADSDELDAMGIEPRAASRPNDERRRGFVEAQGGGALLVVRGDVALRLGLPVRGVLAYAGSFGDGVQSSIPAAGMGVLAAGLGGRDSGLATALGRLGLSADDIAVVSKHDTSTEMNDPNEADVLERLQSALGRTPGNPLLVVSQKALTGHAKGGAAAWQVDGLLRMMERGVVPGNPNLESADPLLREAQWLTLGDRTLWRSEDEPIRAGLITSLGFGHVSALIAIAHPRVFEAVVPDDRRADYLERAARRRAAGVQHRLRTRLGRPDPVRRSDRRLGDADPAAQREAEAQLLTDPTVRLHPDGRYGPPR